MKRVLPIILLLLGSLSFAEKIEHFRVDTTIAQSGELSITETITYDFEAASRHGIYRDIPTMIKNAGVKRDLGLVEFSVMMDDKPVPWRKSMLTSTHAGKILRLKIGSADHLITGIHRYTIIYRH